MSLFQLAVEQAVKLLNFDALLTRYLALVVITLFLPETTTILLGVTFCGNELPPFSLVVFVVVCPAEFILLTVGKAAP